MKYFGLVIKVLIFLGIISGVYYFGYLKLRQAMIVQKASHYSNLVQNRTAYINLAKLNQGNANFNLQKSDLIGIIKETNKKGLENPLTTEERQILEKQNEILGKVFATKSYQEGVAILKSDESVKLLADEAKLIDKYKTK